MGIRRRHRIALGRVQAVEKFCHVIHRGGIVAACPGFGAPTDASTTRARIVAFFSI
jgi:hypothetical protein